MLDLNQLPHLTSDVPGIGGLLRTRREDFIVDEVPLYEPCGQGTHVYFRIRKIGIPTLKAVHEIARALGVPSREIGFAGMKDADAVTTQMLSIEHVDPGRVESLAVPRIQILGVARHGNKLKRGHLAGNRFTIKLRGVDGGRISDLQKSLEVLGRRGVPNYFGPQRFGVRGDTWQIGLAMLRGDYSEAVACMVGRPGSHDHGEAQRARELFDKGNYAAAADAWPYLFANERRVCRAMAKENGRAHRAFRALDRSIQELFLCAYQSYLFNQIVARRLGSLDRLMLGDLAWRHPQGAVFRVDDVGREQPRCDVFEISPTGPLFGRRMSSPTGTPGEQEAALLAETGLALEVWQEGEGRKVTGGRRPLRFRPQEAAIEAGRDQAGDYLELRFRLESGCYATAVLREICKHDPGTSSGMEEEND
ncbi:MAG TPA: tRNA pseudouridine(13) synthase TruD [Phycisphaerae bacterium]|nr:tRNA pseudouridine(13) synthase TruD [Phycisphaerae bacterium]HRY66760.1 tRNA pseudouridine(13) synthase TruD [Phycisphaerae bacterium]HSA28400.1 tRNA pseudouridine(13) synthase TruD [Phycisphaerae bacterium]